MERDLTAPEKDDLLRRARRTLVEAVLGPVDDALPAEPLSDALTARCGVFVSLHIDHRLRGCIGRLIGDEPLYRMVEEMAISAAFHDPRFPALTALELPSVDIEISVLSPMHKILSLDEIQLGKHGVLLRQGFRSGVFLPQVAVETGWTLEQFLGHLARDKAGLDWDDYRLADLYLFTAEVFSEHC